MNEWESWEDWQAGLYANKDAPEPSDSEQARQLLTNSEQFREVAIEMLREWPTAAMQNLCRVWSGRRAWLGQAACCYSLGVNSADVCAAWGEMTNSEKGVANSVAEGVIVLWERGQDA